MPDIFITADTHFGHENIRKYCGRPFASTKEMDDTMISNWNGIVGKRDITYIVGDFAWRFHAKYLQRLNGKKILIFGNHDKMSLAVQKQFTEVHDILVRRIANKTVVFCHYPMLSWPHSGYFSWMIHGHVHGRLKESINVLRTDVGVDIWNYKPIPWDVLSKKMQAREDAIKLARFKKYGPVFSSELEDNIKLNIIENAKL